MESVTSSPTSSPPQSSSPTTPLTCMTPVAILPGSFKQIDPSVIDIEIHSSPNGHPKYHDLSGLPQSEQHPAQTERVFPQNVKESIFCKPDFKSPTSPTRRAKILRDRMLKKHLPYPPTNMISVAPLELRFAARFLGRGCRPEFTIEAMKQVCTLYTFGFKYSLHVSKSMKTSWIALSRRCPPLLHSRHSK